LLRLGSIGYVILLFGFVLGLLSLQQERRKYLAIIGIVLNLLAGALIFCALLMAVR
jgi:hypothetical protein